MSAGELSKNGKSKAGKVGNQRTGFNNTDRGAANESLLTAGRPTTGKSKVIQPSKFKEAVTGEVKVSQGEVEVSQGNVKVSQGEEVSQGEVGVSQGEKVSQGVVEEEKVSAIGIFLKLVTRGLLKKIALPAIVR